MKRNQQASVSVPPFDEVFSDEEWTTIDNKQVCDAFSFFDADPNVQTGFNFRMDAMLNGGVLFKRTGHTMNEHAQAEMSRKFSAFMRAAVRSKWSTGFVACAWVDSNPDDRDGDGNGDPVVLDLTQLTIKFRMSVFGQPMYRYFYQPTMRSFDLIEIPHVLSFSWEPPDIGGNLRSMMLLLVPDSIGESSRAYYTMIAHKSRAMPPMITQKEVKTHDKDKVLPVKANPPVTIRARQSNAAAAAANDNEPVDNTTTKSQVMNSTQRMMGQAQPTLSGTMTEILATVMHVPYFSSNYQLSEGRTFVQPPLPEAPVDYLEFRVARQERAFAVMGIPIAMLTNSSSTGGGKQRSASSGNDGKGNDFLVFENSQQALKLELINIVKKMYDCIYKQAHIEEYLRDTPPEKWKASEAIASADVQVEIPSIPDETKIVDWYTKGFLKYDALIGYLSAKHGIPPDAFNKEPELSIQEANGNFPKDDTAAPAAKKPKKK